MKLQKAFFGLGLLIVIIGSNGCGAIKSTPNPTIPPSTGITGNASMESNKPSSTSTSNITPTSTLKLTMTQTVPLVPTLPAAEAQTKLISLLSDNGNCRLPCFWGIVPGISSPEDAINKLFQLSSISVGNSLRSDGGYTTLGINEGDLRIVIDIEFRVEENKIAKIKLFAWPHDPTGIYIFNSEIYGERLAYYLLSNILNANGRPSSVLISTKGGLNSEGGLPAFEFILLYPDQGILIEYFTIMRISGTNALGCPSNAQIKLDLYPSGNAATFNQEIARSWSNELSWFRPLEDVTSISIEKFYQTFRYSTSQCVVTPLKLWPTPPLEGG